ncbi:hypothetical protein PYW07_002468 [Mythimna separata]|uniref:Uncharacterized protein n=1 Tax=Mythimna separata TaxID=271217 RepID=A0AAD7YNK1_MYTSE|nr:hypothetical protein PYW07_002468 [Mythimna separata]
MEYNIKNNTIFFCTPIPAVVLVSVIISIKMTARPWDALPKRDIPPHMLHRILRVVIIMVTPGRYFRMNPVQITPELTMTGEDLRYAEDKDAVTTFQSLLKELTNHQNDGVPKEFPYVIASGMKISVKEPRTPTYSEEKLNL